MSTSLPLVACYVQDASKSSRISFPKHSFDLLGVGVKIYPMIGLLLIRLNLISQGYFRISNPILSVAFALNGAPGLYTANQHCHPPPLVGATKHHPSRHESR
jgi:hypothetical protein